MGFDELLEPEHDARALQRRNGTPAGQRILRGGDGIAGLVRAGEMDVQPVRARRRVEDGASPAVRHGPAFAVNEISKNLHFRYIL